MRGLRRRRSRLLLPPRYLFFCLYWASVSRSYTIVTGRGLGLDIALVLCSSAPTDGTTMALMPVILGTRDPTATVREIERRWGGNGGEYGMWHETLNVEELDVSSKASIDAFVARMFLRHDGAVPAALVNSAAVCPTGSHIAHDLQEALATNVYGPLRLMERFRFISRMPSQRAKTGKEAERRCVVNISSGDGETKWLHSALGRALTAAKDPGDVLALFRTPKPRNSDDSGGGGGEDGGDSSGLVWKLLEQQEELAFGPSPAYAVSKAALNALTRTLASSSRPPTITRKGARSSSFSFKSKKKNNNNNSSSTTITSDTRTSFLSHASAGHSNDSGSMDIPVVAGLRPGVVVNAVCPGDLVGSAMYSGTGEWDVLPEQAAADVTALLHLGVQQQNPQKPAPGTINSEGSGSGGSLERHQSPPSPTGGFFRFRRRIPM